MKNLGNLSSDDGFYKDYLRILSPKFPEFLREYIATPEMQRLKGTGVSCGCNYTDIYDLKFKCTNLNHSIGVALIIWRFTGDKAATLAGLFHDIASPSFKHSVDYMNGDSEKQESIDEKTEAIIRGSEAITRLLRRDGVKVEAVLDYKAYPIADNDTPRLSADRLEYTLVGCHFWTRVWSLDDIKEIYEDLTVAKNEDGIDELAFQTVKVAEKFVAGTSQQWPFWCNSANKTVLQFIAETLAQLARNKEISVDDLWRLSEDEVIERINNGRDKKLARSFDKFQNATQVYEGDEPVEGVFCRAIKSKIRYIVPLVADATGGGIRVNKISPIAATQIDNFLNIKLPRYSYLDFDLETEGI
jgi:HD superfamily phosphohydrolase